MKSFFVGVCLLLSSQIALAKWTCQEPELKQLLADLKKYQEDAKKDEKNAILAKSHGNYELTVKEIGTKYGAPAAGALGAAGLFLATFPFSAAGLTLALSSGGFVTFMGGALGSVIGQEISKNAPIVVVSATEGAPLPTPKEVHNEAQHFKNSLKKIKVSSRVSTKFIRESVEEIFELLEEHRHILLNQTALVKPTKNGEPIELEKGENGELTVVDHQHLPSKGELLWYYGKAMKDLATRQRQLADQFRQEINLLCDRMENGEPKNDGPKNKDQGTILSADPKKSI